MARARRGAEADAKRRSGGRGAGPRALRVRCAGRPAAELLGEIDDFLHRAGRGETVVVLEDAHRLPGSVSGFLIALARRLVEHPGVVVLRDSSGYAEAFVDLWDLRPEDRRAS